MVSLWNMEIQKISLPIHTNNRSNRPTSSRTHSTRSTRSTRKRHSFTKKNVNMRTRSEGNDKYTVTIPDGDQLSPKDKYQLSRFYAK